jgi:hypothetical protein
MERRLQSSISYRRNTPVRTRLFGLPQLTFHCFALVLSVSGQESEGLPYHRSQPIGREAFLQRVVTENQVIQGSLAAFGAALNLHRAEGGLFQPAFVASSQWVDRKQPNTIQLERSLQSGGIFIERNLVYTGGVEMRTPLGGLVRVGGSARELRNNLQRTTLVDLDAEYETSIDISIEQPLLKNFGPTMTLAPRRMAAHNAEIGYQDYRRQLMRTVAQAEVAYWELALAQEQFRLSEDSVATAQALLDESQAKAEAGRGTQLDVIEAEAGLAQRHSRRTRAQQNLIEAIGRLSAFIGVEPEMEGVRLVANESPQVVPVGRVTQTGPPKQLVWMG